MNDSNKHGSTCDFWPEAVARQIDQACQRFEARLNDGQLPRIEEFLGECEESLRDDLLNELLAVEVAWHRQRGTTLVLDEYLKRFPLQRNIVETVFRDALHFQSNSASKPINLPQAIANYEILAELGRGGMGVVYKARQRNPRRIVALKIITEGRHDDEGRRVRFQTEADAIASLQSPNIVQIFESGEDNGVPFIAMEFVNGVNLDKRSRDRQFTCTEAAELVETLARAVQDAHRQKIIHRDLKPSNILLTENGTPKIADFGLAKRLEVDGGTASKAGMGTPAYMSPEQAASAKEVGFEADVYSLGAILYELLTGRPPFAGSSPAAIILQVMTRAPVPPSKIRPEVPRDLEAVALKCLEKDPCRRYPTAEAMAQDLRNFRNGRPTNRPLSVSLRLEADLYFKNIALAERELAANNAGQAGQFIDACPIELRGWEWRCLRNLQRHGQRILSDHKDVVYSVTFSKDGNKLATASDDQSILIWDVQTNRAIKSLTGNNDQIYVIRFSPNGKRLAAASQDGFVNVWSVDDGTRIRFSGHADVVVGIDWSDDGRWIISGSDDKTVKIWDAKHGNVVRTLIGHGDMVNGVALSPNCTRIGSGSYDETVRIWDRDSGQEVQRFYHGGFVWSVAFSADGKRLASAGGNGTVRVWDLDTGEETHEFRGHSGAIWSVVFSTDGSRLASGGEDKTVRLWDLATCQEAVAFRAHRDAVNSVAFSPDGNWLASASADRTVRLWDATPRDDSNPAIRRTFTEHASFVNALAWSPDDRLIASASDDRTVKLWNPANGEVLRTMQGHTALVATVVFSPNQNLIASAGADKTIRIWDVQSGELRRLVSGHKDRIYALAFSPDGKRIVSAGWDRDIMIWDVESGLQIGKRVGHTNWILDLAFHPDGDRFASASTDRKIFIWRLIDDQIHQAMEGHELKVQGVAYSLNGQWLASAGGDETVCLWNATTGKEQIKLRGHADRVCKVAFHPSSKLLASAGEDQTVRLWEIPSGKATGILRGHGRQVNDIAFSHCGEYLASASDDGTARIWNLDIRD